METPPPSSDIDATVWRTLHDALATNRRVRLRLRGDPARGRPVRELAGRLARFDLDVDGDVRVVLAVAEGTEQRVVVARIARALLEPDAPTPGAPTAALLGDSLALCAAVARVLAGHGWHVETLALQDAPTVALAAPALVTLVAAPQRAEATLAAAQRIRRDAALAQTPMLVAALAHWDIAPGFRALAGVRVMIAPFDDATVRAALADLGVAARSA